MEEQKSLPVVECVSSGNVNETTNSVGIESKSAWAA